MACSATDISLGATTGYLLCVTYGEWIRAIRTEAGLSQARFAERIDIGTHVTISNLERGKFRPDRTTIEKILEAFPTAPAPPGWAKPPTNSSPKTITVQSYEARELAVRLDKQPREVRMQVRDIVERLLRPPRRQPRKGPKAGPTGPKSGR